MSEVTPAFLEWDRVIPHPRNENKMTDRARGKLKAHIARTGLYRRGIVRSLELSKECAAEHARGLVQFLDGHHTCAILKELEHEGMNVDIWPGVTDQAADIYIATLNRLAGQADSVKRAELLRRIREDEGLDPGELAEIMPEEEDEIRKMLEEAENDPAGLGSDGGSPEPEPEMFAVYLTTEQMEEVKRGLGRWIGRYKPDGNKEQRDTAALVAVCHAYAQEHRPGGHPSDPKASALLAACQGFLARHPAQVNEDPYAAGLAAVCRWYADRAS